MDNPGYQEDGDDLLRSPVSSSERSNSSNQIRLSSTNNIAHNKLDARKDSKLTCSPSYAASYLPNSPSTVSVHNYQSRKIFSSASFNIPKSKCSNKRKRLSQSLTLHEDTSKESKQKPLVCGSEKYMKHFRSVNGTPVTLAKNIFQRKYNNSANECTKNDVRRLSDRIINNSKMFRRSFSLNNNKTHMNENLPIWKTSQEENNNIDTQINGYCCQNNLSNDSKMATLPVLYNPLEINKYKVRQNDGKSLTLGPKIQNSTLYENESNFISSFSDFMKPSRNTSTNMALPTLPSKTMMCRDADSASPSGNVIPTVSANIPMYYSNFYSQSSPKPYTENRKNMRRSSKFSHLFENGKELRNARLMRRSIMGGWKLQFISSNSNSKKRILALSCILITVCFLILVSTGLVLYLTASTGSKPVKLASAWDVGETGVNVVEGEFRILNENFKSSLEDHTSVDFIHLANNITEQFDIIFSSNSLTSHYNHSHVMNFKHVPENNTKGLIKNIIVVQCKLVFSSVPADGMIANLVGLEFLKALHHHHGQMWLDKYIIDILSIKFVAVKENSQEISTETQASNLLPGWSDWSQWTKCNTSAGETSFVSTQSRTRECRLNNGVGEILLNIEPCVLLDGNGGDLEVRDCDHTEYATIMSANVFEEEFNDNTLVGYDFSNRNLPWNSTTKVMREVGKQSAEIVSMKNQSVWFLPVTSAEELVTLSRSNTNTTPVTGKSMTEEIENGQEDMPVFICDMCGDGEVCVALSDDPEPKCRVPVDSADPTGCGGYCLIDVEVCRRLDENVYRCADNSFCLGTEWRCINKLCIPKSKRCDGHMNCYDHTDEYNCDCNLVLNFHCGNNTSCLPKEKRCDGVIDCWDGTDELLCTTACPNATQFTCNNGQCIPHTRFCDGYADCDDKSDEPFGCGGKCKNHEWKCRNGRCILKQGVCDGIDTCGDLSDENNCHKIRLGSTK